VYRPALVALFVLVLIPLRGGATSSWRPPLAKGEFASPNGQFILTANPATGEYVVCATGNRDAPLWSFAGEPGCGNFLVTDDGQTVIDLTLPAADFRNFTNWPVNSPCLRFWGLQGERKVYRLTELCSNTTGVGATGILGAWRDWYTEAWQDEEAVTVRTRDGTQYTFSLGDGAIRYQEPVWQVQLRKALVWLLVCVGVVVLGVIITMTCLVMRRRWQTQTVKT